MVVVAVAVDVAGRHSTNTSRSEAASRRLRRQRLRAWYASHDPADGSNEGCATPPRRPAGIWKDSSPEKTLLVVAGADNTPVTDKPISAFNKFAMILILSSTTYAATCADTSPRHHYLYPISRSTG